MLADVAASFECRRTKVYDGGDHVILLGCVEHYCRYDRQPLLFAKGRYAVAADHPETRVLSTADDLHSPLGLDEQLLLQTISKQDLAVVQRALSRVIADLS